MENNNYLVESFGNSIGVDIAEFTGEVIEFTLDTCVGEDGILKDIPFVSAALKLYNIANQVQEKYSFYKLNAFIKGVNDGAVDSNEIERRKKKFYSNVKFRKQELEYILVLIERYIGLDKPTMLAKMYLAYLDDIISWKEFTVYAEVIDRLLPGDINELEKGSQYDVHYKNASDALLRLVSLGLVVEHSKGIDFDNTCGSLNLPDLQQKDYEITMFGNKLIKILSNMEA